MFDATRYSPKAIKRGLLNGLIDYWPLTEQSGSRSSLTGTRDLTDNNTVTGNPGLFGQASQFTAANVESLSRADDAGLSISGSPFTVSAWCYIDTKAADANTVFAKRSGAGTGEWSVARDNGTDRFVFYNVQGAVLLTDSVFGVPPLSTWIFIVCWWDLAYMGMSINAGEPDRTASASGFADTTALFKIGIQQTSSFPWDGRISDVGMWKRVLSRQEIDFMYNNGIGRPLFYT